MKSKKRLAGDILNVSPSKIIFAVDALEEIKKAITRADIRGLIAVKKITKNIPNLIIPFTEISIYSHSAYHIFPVLLPDNVNRIMVMDELKNNGVQTSIHYPSFKDFMFYKKYSNCVLANADKISKRVLTLPLYPNMTMDMIDKVTDTFSNL